MSTQKALGGKEVVSFNQHGAVVPRLTIGYAHLGNAAHSGAYPKLELTPRDVQTFQDVDAAMQEYVLLGHAKPQGVFDAYPVEFAELVPPPL